MAYEKTLWKDRVVEKPNTYRTVENPDGTITLYPITGQVIEKGTPISAANLNKIENGIVEIYEHLDNMAINIISKGGASENLLIDNSKIINKSFEYGDTVFVPDGNFYCKTEITIPYNKKLFLSPKCTLIQLNDIDFIKFRNGSKLQGGTIKIAYKDYSKSCLSLDGSAKIDDGIVSDCLIIAQDTDGKAILTGTGIEMFANGNEFNYISFFKFNNVKIQYFNTGLLLDSDENINSYVNGNIFEGITLVGCVNHLKFGKTDNKNCICNGNKFNNIQFQDIDGNTNSMIIWNGGSQNTLTNIHFWDIPEGKKAMIMRKYAYFNLVEHNLWFKHDEKIIGYWEQNRNIQIINGYHKDLNPYDVGSKNVGVISNPWNNVHSKNITGLDSIKSLGILEQESIVDAEGYTWKARLGASKWGYITIQILKSKDGVDIVVKELRLLQDGSFYPHGSTINLGTPQNRYNMMYGNYLNLKSRDGNSWTITVNNDGTLNTSKD